MNTLAYFTTNGHGGDAGPNYSKMNKLDYFDCICFACEYNDVV